MDSDIELTIKEQYTLFQMLESDDLETRLLAFSIIDSSKKPGVFINVIPNKKRSCSFFYYVRIKAFETIEIWSFSDNKDYNVFRLLSRLCNW